MKTKCILILLLVTATSFSQPITVKDIIKFSNDVAVIGNPTAARTGVDLSIRKFYLEAGYKFKVLAIDATQAKVQAFNFESPSAKKRSKKPTTEFSSDFYNDKVYTISRADLDAFAERVEEIDRLSIGLLTLPFKARPQGDMTFDTEFNFNATLNFTLFRLYDITSLNYQVGAGIGSVGLNTSNSSMLESTEAQDVATLTFLNGVMVQYKQVQFGIYAGVDFINNQKNYGWESNGNIWLGFGVGYNLFDISLATAKNNDAN